MTPVSVLAKSSSSKEAIISLLSERWPLSVKEIHAVLVRSFSLQLTYQAVHKSLLLLAKEGVLEKTGAKYQLNKSWIRKIKNLGNHLEQLYSAPNTVRDFASGEVVNLSFDRFADFGRFVIFTFHDQFPNPLNKPGVYLLEHAWATAGFDEPEVKKLMEVYQKTPNFLVVAGKTPLDYYFSMAYEKLGKHCLVGKKSPFGGEFLVSGDYVAQHFFSQEFKQKFYGLYKKVKSPDQLNPLDFLNLYYEKQPIRVVITKNAELADALREFVFDLKKKK